VDAYKAIWLSFAIPAFWTDSRHFNTLLQSLPKSNPHNFFWSGN
jgi:hypothetical protein